MPTYDYDMPSLTADIVIMRNNQDLDVIEVLLIERGNEPFKGMLALPGGFANKDETLIETASRELNEETGLELETDDLYFIGLFDTPGRDPRGWVVTAAFAAYLDMEYTLDVIASDDAVGFEWVPIHALIGQELAFDHNTIICRAFLNYFGGDTYGS